MKKWFTSENITTFVLMATAAAVGVVILAPLVSKIYGSVRARVGGAAS